MSDGYKVGDYIIYVNDDRYEIGRVKKVCEDGCFVCYHSGETAAKTPYDTMHPIINGCFIRETSLGGQHDF